MRLGADVQPESNGALRVRARLQVVDDERRLRLFMDVKTRPRTSTLTLVHSPGARSTYDSYFSGVSFRKRDQVHSGWEMYCAEWLRRT